MDQNNTLPQIPSLWYNVCPRHSRMGHLVVMLIYPVPAHRTLVHIHPRVFQEETNAVLNRQKLSLPPPKKKTNFIHYTRAARAVSTE